MNQLLNSVRSFAVEEDGAQVVEYALIIAVVSILLVDRAAGLTNGTGFAQLINRVTNCLTGTTNTSCQ